MGHFDKDRGNAQGSARASSIVFLMGRIESLGLDYRLAQDTSGRKPDLAGRLTSLRLDSQ